MSESFAAPADGHGAAAPVSRRVASNAVWNTAGGLASLLVGLVSLSILLRTMGAARLGVFTLAIGLIGFSGLLDLGLGRALTQGVASALGAGRSRVQVASLVWRVLLLLGLSGLAWAAALWFAMPMLVSRLFNLDGQLLSESVFGLRAVALSLPLALVSTGALGALEGLQQFRRISVQKVALSIVQFGLPALVSLWKPDVGWVTAALACSRILATGVWVRSLHASLPLASTASHTRDDLAGLLRFGGWLSVSNVVGPLMVYADRFYLATLFPPGAVASYTIPYDSLFRVTSLPLNAIGAVFPALAESGRDAAKSMTMLRMSAVAIAVLMLPPLLLASVFASPLLTLWMGPDFAEQSATITKWLIIGVFVNSCAHAPYAWLQAHGRTDLTAKLHLLELPVFAVILVASVWRWGLPGAAVAWALRVGLDAILLYGAVARSNVAHRSVLRFPVELILVSLLLLALPLATSNVYLLGLDLVAALTACVTLGLRLGLSWHKAVRQP